MTTEQVKIIIQNKINSTKTMVNATTSYRHDKITAYKFMLEFKLFTIEQLKSKLIMINENPRNLKYGYWRAFVDVIDRIEYLDKYNNKNEVVVIV